MRTNGATVLMSITSSSCHMLVRFFNKLVGTAVQFGNTPRMEFYVRAKVYLFTSPVETSPTLRSHELTHRKSMGCPFTSVAPCGSSELPKVTDSSSAVTGTCGILD